jgi:hypothetical protein
VPRDAVEAERLEALAIAADARARRSVRPREARTARAEAEALRRRARELRAIARARPPLVVVRAEPRDGATRGSA